MSNDAGPPLLRLAKVFDVFQILLSKGISTAAIQAILYIGMVSSEHESPVLAGGSDIARALGMSQSGTSRLLSNLLNEEKPYISSDREINDGKSASFFLTPEGKRLIEGVLSSIYEADDGNCISPLDLASYGKLKYIDKKGNFGLKCAKEHASGLVMTLEAVDDSTFDAIRRWMDRNKTKSKLQRASNNICVTFSSFGFACLFMSRWGLKNKYLE